MALEDFCGFYKENSNFKSTSDIDYQHELSNLTGNFRDNLSLALPPTSAMAVFDETFSESNEVDRPVKIKLDHGTTTLGFMYRGGILIAVDSRATGGAYIGSQTIKKVIGINDFLLGTLAGGAADCIYWDRVLAKHCRMYELRNNERISVASASKLMTNMIYNYKKMGLSIGMMIAGWDKRGPGLYYIDNSGIRTKGNIFSVGSGSFFAYGVLDSGYKWDLSDEEAHELGRRAIYHATFRDSMSGGIIRVYQIKEEGWIHISDEDCSDLHYKYEAQVKK